MNMSGGRPIGGSEMRSNRGYLVEMCYFWWRDEAKGY
jgi:hypothetical protein